MTAFREWGSRLIRWRVTTFLMVFGLRLIATDGPLGEEPEWRGFALQIHDWRVHQTTVPKGVRP